MNLNLNKQVILENRLINYWQLFFYNKYLYSFFNSFCKEGKRGFTLKLIYLLLSNLKNKTGIPPILLLKSILINFKQLFKINIKKFKRRKFYSVLHLSHDRQIKQSIQNLTKYFHLINSNNHTESLINKLTYFFLNLFFKTKNFYGRYLSSLVDNQNKIKDIIDDAEDRIIKKNKNRFKRKRQNLYVKRLISNHRKRIHKLKEEEFINKLEEDEFDVNKDSLVNNQSKTKLLFVDKFLIKKKDLDHRKEALKQYKFKNWKSQKNLKKFKRKKFSKYKKPIYDKYNKYHKFFKYNKNNKLNRSSQSKNINNNKINDTTIFNQMNLNHFNDLNLTNIEMNSLYPKRNTIREKLIYFFIKLELKKIYYLIESMYFFIFKSNMSIFDFKYKKDYFNETLKENEKIENNSSINKEDSESKFRFKNFALWFFHIYLGLNEELSNYADKHVLQRVTFNRSLSKRLNEYYIYYYNSSENDIVKNENINHKLYSSIAKNDLKLDIITKKILIKEFKKQFNFFNKRIEKRKNKLNLDSKEREKERLKEKNKRKVLFSKIKFILRNHIFNQINKKMNRFITLFFRRLGTYSKTINFKKKRKRFIYKFIPRATINYLN